MKKPTAVAIRSALPLSQRPERGPDPLRVCNVCGRAVDPTDLPLEIWREHDEHDRPIPGVDALVFLGAGSAHAPCRKTLDAHPRLYAEDGGAPGAFPQLCVPCVHRQGLACRHPDLMANGGSGLLITLSRLAAVVCVRGRGCHRPVAHAVKCAGLTVERDGKEVT